MKIVICAKHGGFGLSMLAVKRMAELKKRPCYFFKQDDFRGPFTSIEPGDKAGPLGIFFAFDVPNPNEVIPRSDSPVTFEESNKLWKSHGLEMDDVARDDADLVRVVEELGEQANGCFAKLVVVEIPDDVKWEIQEYDGYETIHEVHRSWP